MQILFDISLICAPIYQYIQSKCSYNLDQVSFLIDFLAKALNTHVQCISYKKHFARRELM